MLSDKAMEWFMAMASPKPLLMTIAIYLLFVIKIGPLYMRDRKPMELKNFIRAYNVFQVIACSYFVKTFVDRGVNFKNTWQCIHHNPYDTPEAVKIGCMFIMLRIIEFIETVMFVLRKKQNQVSSLHIYHHISTVVLLWLFFNYHPSKSIITKLIV